MKEKEETKHTKSTQIEEGSNMQLRSIFRIKTKYLFKWVSLKKGKKIT